DRRQRADRHRPAHKAVCGAHLSRLRWRLSRLPYFLTSPLLVGIKERSPAMSRPMNEGRTDRRAQPSCAARAIIKRLHDETAFRTRTCVLGLRRLTPFEQGKDRT